MRLQHLFKAILGSSLIATGGLSLQAQPPGSPGGGGTPPMMMDPSSAFSAAGYGQLPPSMYQAWPQMSAYDSPYTQHAFDGGVWSQTSDPNFGSVGNRRFILNVDYINGRARTSDALVGNPNAQRYIDVIRPQLTQGAGGGGGQQQQNPILTAYGGVPNSIPGTQLPSFELYGPARMKDMGRRFNLDGTRVTWGFENADDSGLRLNFDYITDGSFQYNAKSNLTPGRGTEPQLFNTLLRLPEDPADPNTILPRDLSLLSNYVIPNDVNRALQNNVFNLNGIPLDDGTIQTLSDGTQIGGVTVPYDLDFRIDLRNEMYGGNAEWVLAPILKTSFLRVRPTVGMRYYLLREGFHFYGRDSGLAYTSSGGQGGGAQNLSPDMKIHSTPDGIDDNSDGIIDNAGVFEGGQGGGGGGGAQQTTAVFLQFHDQFRYPISSFLDNGADSHMGGGLIGMSYDIGGSSLVIGGSTKFGLMANHERIQMSGDNIAMHTRESNLLFPTPADATPNSFADSQQHTHVSPIFEQTFSAEAPLLRYVPVLRRFSLIERAQFRVGYSLLYIGEVVDPSDSISWRGNPAAGIFPTIKYRRDNYTSRNLNFGLSWQF